MNSLISNKKGFHILHLEDNSFDVDLLQLQLQSLSFPYSLKQVTSEVKFKEAFFECPPDIVVSDSNLPGFDTGNALTFVRENYPDIPFLFFSGQLSPLVQEEALAKGASVFIDKNDLGRLVSAIEQFRQKKFQRLPAVGHAVIVQCDGFRCLAYRNTEGKWIDFSREIELHHIDSWEDV